MKPSSAKNKGRVFQQEVRKMLIDALGINEQDIKNTSSGCGGEDLQLAKAARDIFPFQIECKSLASIAVYKYYEQCKNHGEHEPIVFIKANRKKPLVILDANTFLKLCKNKLIN